LSNPTLPPEAVAWLRHAAASGETQAQILLAVVQRLEALEARTAASLVAPQLQQPERVSEEENDRRFRACMAAIDAATPEQINEALGTKQQGHKDKLDRLIEQDAKDDEGPQTLHTIALGMVDTLEQMHLLPEILDTLRRAIREPMQQADPETAPVAPDEELRKIWRFKSDAIVSLRDVYNLGREHGAAAAHCPHIRGSDEGTSYCALAEQAATVKPTSNDRQIRSSGDTAAVDLSSAAQAVKDAVLALCPDERVRGMAWPLAKDEVSVALRAVADQVVPAGGSRKNNEIRFEILAIAAELAADYFADASKTAPTPEAAPVAPDHELIMAWDRHMRSDIGDRLRVVYNLGREHGAAAARCPHIRSSDEGTSYCALAEQTANFKPTSNDCQIRSLSDALGAAECALADIAEREPEPGHGPSSSEWGERRCADALAIIRPVMKRYGIHASGPVAACPPPVGGLVETVARSIGQDGHPVNWRPEARRAVRQVAEWLAFRGQPCAQWLRDELEAGRG